MAASLLMRLLHGLLALLLMLQANAEYLIEPGDPALTSDLLLLNDTGIVDLPTTSWPISESSLRLALQSVDVDDLTDETRLSFSRLQSFVATRPVDQWAFSTRAEFAINPLRVRTYEDTPRSGAVLGGSAAWRNSRVVINAVIEAAANSPDGDSLRWDGTYVGMNAGNWLVSLGWQPRWFGPGRNGSLILSTSARPAPALSVQRRTARPFRSRWLSWMGPWTLQGFSALLDDERLIEDAHFIAIRGSFRPIQGLEIGITRTAQWCGKGRPCDLRTFADLLVGNDNSGVNVAANNEPGNQLGGFDLRYSMSKLLPVVVHMQWIGEDGRGGGGAIGSWMRQLGVESWGRFGEATIRTHFEISDTACNEGGFGFSGRKSNCGYEHAIYRSGYRYNGDPLGHSSDGDSLVWSVGSTLVQSGGHSWGALIRYMELNRDDGFAFDHRRAPTGADRVDVLLTHNRYTNLGQFGMGLLYQRTNDALSSRNESSFGGYIKWNSQ